MSGLVADTIGLIGSAIFITAFAYFNLVSSPDLRLFNFANFIGAVMVIVSLTVHFNLPSMILESVWATIALFGLIRALARGARI